MERKTYVVNFIAGPGCGKSTISALIFAHLKLNHNVVEYVQEFAKQLVWMKDDNLNNQYYVSSQQSKLFTQMEGLVEFIVTDGPIIQGLYYNLFNRDNTSDVKKTEELILNKYHHFLNINIFLERGEFPYETQGRQQTEQQAREIDVILKHLLNRHHIPFVCFPGNCEPSNIQKIMDFILSQTK